ncbi:uncharacterized protein ATNIH1004_002967 [Aspergillus tanneri]|uniref:Uncharacterized protein n=1 Tax=Aspergillus tanneri TaxID=1220188 RepID=A0A5M9MT76_9EURO|nr:uncharacterized protein ATNIH1004_002967 [Aspergillus tanneri]KAA8650285.1 hypothetical protein ATNIH1004_002967 [Aspergillus tanneri]
MAGSAPLQDVSPNLTLVFVALTSVAGYNCLELFSGSSTPSSTEPVTIVGLAIGYFCMVTSLSMVLDSPPGSFIHLRILYNQQALGTSHPSPSSESPQPAPSYASTSFWAYYEAIRSLKPIMEVKGREGRKVLNIVTIINVIFTLLDGGAIATQIDNH